MNADVIGSRGQGPRGGPCAHRARRPRPRAGRGL